MKRRSEYIEGDKARENFEKFASAILQVPKVGAREPAKAAKKTTARKKRGKDKG